MTLLFAALTDLQTSYLWLTGSLIFAIMLIIGIYFDYILDFMFSNEKSFTYDPDYNNWKSKTQTEY